MVKLVHRDLLDLVVTRVKKESMAWLVSRGREEYPDLVVAKVRKER